MAKRKVSEPNVSITRCLCRVS